MSYEPFAFKWRRKGCAVARMSRIEPLEVRSLLSVSDELAPVFAGALATDADVPVVVSPQHGGEEHFSGDVTVTATQIITPSELIPRFVAQPTNTSIRSGNWNAPSTWSAGRVPVAGDRVLVAEGTEVTYSAISTARIDSLEIGGSLVFSTSVNTRLLVATITVMPAGRLQIGTSDAPVAAGVKAELVIADKPLDPINDPRQYGTGLIVLGEITIHGDTRDLTWDRLAAEPRAGQSFLRMNNSSTSGLDWRAGDVLVLPDSRQVPSSQLDKFVDGNFTGQWEKVTVSRVEGSIVYLTAPLKFDHLGARNVSGGLELLPHVALLTRNVVVRSENPDGTRGHTIYIARADVDIQYARFQDLGRTDALRPLDNSRFGAAGNLTHFGTNQIGRYPVHIHHVQGPENPTNTGYQFQFIGNTVDSSRRWAVAVHDTSFGLVDKNVVYDAQGAGFVTEDGSEIGNTFSNNITIRMVGTNVDGKDGTTTGDYGRGGSGFWFRRSGNSVIGNVAADSSFAGFVIDGYNLDEITIPVARGAIKTDPGQGITTRVSPRSIYGNNEAYGMSRYGFWAAFTNGYNSVPNQPLTLIINLKLWNIADTGVLAYHTANLTFQNLWILGDLSARDRNDSGPRGMDLTVYENFGLTVRNSRIEGMYVGFYAPTKDSSTAGVEQPTILQNVTFKNFINIRVTPAKDRGTTGGNYLEVRDSMFTIVDGLPRYPVSAPPRPGANIDMQLTGQQPNLTQYSVVRVYNYNQVQGDDFQVWYREQAPGYVLPKTDSTVLGHDGEGVIGSPVGGLTNQQNWDRYRIALAGAIAPSSARASRSEINGLVSAIADLRLLTPSVVLVTPWDNAVISGNQRLKIRYNLIGLLPEGASIWFQLDNGPLIPSTFKDGGFERVPLGAHVLKAWVGDSQGRLRAGTSVTTSRFTLVA